MNLNLPFISLKRSMITLLAVTAIVVNLSCGSRNGTSEREEDVLVEYGDSVLTMRDVLYGIPSGLSPEDSVEMFRNLTDQWVRNMVLTDIAMENEAELEKINKMAEDYRNNLIIERYLRGKQDEVKSVSDSEIKRYYESNKEDMVLEAPLIKGVYLKLSDSDTRLTDVRKWMASCSPEDIDRIEKGGLRNASQYEYFLDRWIEWGKISEQIPYRFYDADAFLRSTKDFETTYGGSVYLLHITDFVASGSVMPEEYASSIIENMLMQSRRSDYKQSLLRSLYQQGIKEGKLRIGSYDPVKRELRDESKIKN